MNAEQFFYGRGPDGYAMLGASVPSCGLTDQVLDLCQSVGTPGFEREDDNQPFLLQKVCGANVLMACGRNGEPDSLGRKTLFFHVVVVPLAYAKKQKISTADLYRADVFSTKCRAGKLSALTIDGVKGESAGETDSRFKFPAVFSCRRANNLALVSLLCGNLVGTNWATMCWRVMPGFDWFGLDESRHVDGLSAGYSVYDVNGKLLRRCGGEKCEMESSESEAVDSSPSKLQKGSRMKTGFAFAIVGLLVGLGLGWFARGNLKPKIEKDEDLSTRAEIEDHIRKEFDAEIKELKAKLQAVKAWPVFDETYYIADFKAAMEKDKTYAVVYGKKKDEPGSKALRDLFGKLEAYVEFVNTNFCNQANSK